MKRYHALDSLRASMMMLGIWLHAVVGYSRGGGWPYKDAHPTAAYDWTLALIHTFRMPLFFVMAGFFGSLLWDRGRERFAVNRTKRILFPFAIFWVCLYPLVFWMGTYSRNWSHADAVSRATQYILSGAFLGRLHPLHLWFLEYLAILCAVAYPVVAVVETCWRSERLRGPLAWLYAGYRAAVKSGWGPVLFAIPSALVLMLMPGGFLEDPPGFLPLPRIVLAYAIPFFFGWVLYRSRDLLSIFTRRAWVQTAVALALVGLWMAFMNPFQSRPEHWYWVKPLRSAVGAAVCWLLVFGLTGVFLKYSGTERPLARYLSDASYWMYLAHMPVVMAFQMALAPLAWPATVKVLLVVGLSFPVLVLSYDTVVRKTWIGVLLNGRCYERWFILAQQTRDTAEA